jgi:hypothetical protein
VGGGLVCNCRQRWKIGDIWIGVAVGVIVGNGVGVTVMNKVGVGFAVVVEVMVAARDGEGSARLEGSGVTNSVEHPVVISQKIINVNQANNLKG